MSSAVGTVDQSHGPDRGGGLGLAQRAEVGRQLGEQRFSDGGQGTGFGDGPGQQVAQVGTDPGKDFRLDRGRGFQACRGEQPQPSGLFRSLVGECEQAGEELHADGCVGVAGGQDDGFAPGVEMGVLEEGAGVSLVGGFTGSQVFLEGAVDEVDAVGHRFAKDAAALDHVLEHGGDRAVMCRIPASRWSKRCWLRRG